ncbi:MAG: pyruvate, phosphate dikinase [Spirochaetes bacterium]|nr:pyruvate, phosphate dikinase [Spirochaetota bacterium]MBU1082306.1 pyruvate, phosphate dikinase [Spirochaetota bacterium]
MYFNELVASYDRERHERDIFHDLMRNRVREILLVASLYDSFVLESDGALSEQIYGEFFKLNLTTAPRVTCAYTPEAAIEMFGAGGFDMVILMAGLDFDVPLALAKRMKSVWPNVPVLLLAMNNSSLAGLGSGRLSCDDVIDRVFVWNGYSKLFVGMIKYVEDRWNVDNDTRVGMVRVVLLIEDSVRYYSRYLPLLYSVVMKQTQQLVEEEKSVETYKILRMRGRPKVLLATSYEEAMSLYERYEPYLLTVISDVRFGNEGVEDPEAGFRFLAMTKQRKPDLPVMIQSSEPDNREKAYALGASFADKNSNTLARELGKFFQSQLGFGPFVFRNPEGEEISRARNMDEFGEQMRAVPAESLLYHADRNHFSAWLMARGEVRFARIIRNYLPEDFSGPAELRDFICRALDDLQRGKARGVIPAVGASTADRGLSRLGGGSVGGKGRGLAFIKSLIDNLAFPKAQNGMEIRLPYTAFIGIDEFERFMDQHGLWGFSWYAAPESEVRKAFLARPLDPELVSRLRAFLSTTDKPLAVRSSGLFEDMLMVPFSGVYDTFLIPNADPDPERRLGQLCDAIKLIYASLYSESARAYFDVASYKIEEERMAVVVQELVGRRKGRWYYPLVAGTAQSYNYYPVSYLKPDDGLCVAALGLGPYVVEGGEAHRFSPRYPKLDVVAPGRGTSGTQRWFYALDMERLDFDLSAGEEATLSRLDLSEAEADPGFATVASTWSVDDDRLEPGVSARGPRILDFAPVLKYDAFPFAAVVDAVLEVGAKSMGIPVEIEYAISDDGLGGAPVFYVLQIKPLIQHAGRLEVDIDGVDTADCLIVSERSMGNGRDETIRDVIWVDPERFDRSRTEAMALEIEAIDRELKALGRRYVLIGPGRWGTRDRWLGVPVSFSQISSARVIVEADLPDFRVDSSLGSHFFHNVTSMNIGYLTVPWGGGAGKVDWAWLAGLPVERRTESCVWASLASPLDIVMDGKRGRSIVRKPRS